MSEYNLKKKLSEGAFRIRQPSQQRLRSHVKTNIKVVGQQMETPQNGINVVTNSKQKVSLDRVSPEKKVVAQCDHGKLIEEMKRKIVGLENRNKVLVEEKRGVEKKLDEVGKELEEVKERVEELMEENRELRENNKEKERVIFTLQLQLKHYKEQNKELKIEVKETKQKLQTIHYKIGLIENSNMVEISNKIPLMILKVQDYKKLRQEIYALKKRIGELELQKEYEKESQQINKKREIVMDRYERQNIGEQIVRLKRNIDRGMGDDNSQYTQTFLNKFREVEKTLSSLMM